MQDLERMHHKQGLDDLGKCHPNLIFWEVLSYICLVLDRHLKVSELAPLRDDVDKSVKSEEIIELKGLYELSDLDQNVDFVEIILLGSVVKVAFIKFDSDAFHDNNIIVGRSRNFVHLKARVSRICNQFSTVPLIVFIWLPLRNVKEILVVLFKLCVVVSIILLCSLNHLSFLVSFINY